LIAGCSTHILTDSPSQRNFLIAEGIVNERKISVLADGSISGVNTIRFAASDIKRNEVREQLSISKSAIVFIFIGRLNFEKGINDLVKAFTCSLEIVPDIELLVVGEDEGVYCSIVSNISQKIKNKIHRIDWTDFPEHYICASDVVCLPSYREGFGNVLIESAAIGLPSIASNIYGVTDAVINGRTGILHEPGNISQLALAMQHLAQNSIERKKMGQIAKKRALELFSESRLSLAYLDFIDVVTADQ
jgi:glycosyltransferase involved in cell wall biosynthesis